jgi:hypothetical protein
MLQSVLSRASSQRGRGEGEGDAEGDAEDASFRRVTSRAIASSTPSVSFSTSLSQKRNTVYPCSAITRVRDASRAARSACWPPSTSTTSSGTSCSIVGRPAAGSRASLPRRSSCDAAHELAVWHAAFDAREQHARRSDVTRARFLPSPSPLPRGKNARERPPIQAGRHQD